MTALKLVPDAPVETISIEDANKRATEILEAIRDAMMSLHFPQGIDAAMAHDVAQRKPLSIGGARCLVNYCYHLRDTANLLADHAGRLDVLITSNITMGADA